MRRPRKESAKETCAPPLQECPVCRGSARLFHARRWQVYYDCGGCGAISLQRAHLPQPRDEKQRYLQHRNDVCDPRYRAFVEPLVRGVQRGFGPNQQGLDFGSGTGPVAARLLEEAGYHLRLWDPFFAPRREVLEQHYDFIVCCEVMEHFHHPDREFALLRTLLRPQGALFCMTGVYDPSVDFGSWAYKNDTTHVVFYRRETLAWIARRHGFSRVEIEGRLITLHG